MTTLSCADVRELAPAYALDALDASVAAAVRAHLAGHPGAHPEFGELAEIAPALAYLTDPVDPPATLKARVLAAAAATAQEAPVRAAPAHVAPAAIASPRGPQPAERRQGWRGLIPTRRVAVAQWAFAAAAVVAIVALVFANVGLQRDVSNASQFNEQMQRALSLAAAPGSRIAVIGPAAGTAGSSGSGVAGGPTGLAVIPASGSGVLVMQGLGASEGNGVYEAWAIVGKAAPVPIGSFVVGGDGLGWLSELAVPAGDSVVVALTREPGPGATKPTLPIVASGAAAPPQ